MIDSAAQKMKCPPQKSGRKNCTVRLRPSMREAIRVFQANHQIYHFSDVVEAALELYMKNEGISEGVTEPRSNTA